MNSNYAIALRRLLNWAKVQHGGGTTYSGAHPLAMAEAVLASPSSGKNVEKRIFGAPLKPRDEAISALMEEWKDRTPKEFTPVEWDAFMAIEHGVPEPQVPAGYALVPIRLTPAMQEVLNDDDWDWPDLLVAAEAISFEDYADAQSPAPATPKDGDEHTE